MVAIVGDSAQMASIGLHRAVGFEMAGALRNIGHNHERWPGTKFLQVALGEGARTSPEPRRARSRARVSKKFGGGGTEPPIPNAQTSGSTAP